MRKRKNTEGSPVLQAANSNNDITIKTQVPYVLGIEQSSVFFFFPKEIFLIILSNLQLKDIYALSLSSKSTFFFLRVFINWHQHAFRDGYLLPIIKNISNPMLGLNDFQRFEEIYSTIFNFHFQKRFSNIFDKIKSSVEEDRLSKSFSSVMQQKEMFAPIASECKKLSAPSRLILTLGLLLLPINYGLFNKGDECSNWTITHRFYSLLFNVLLIEFEKDYLFKTVRQPMMNAQAVFYVLSFWRRQLPSKSAYSISFDPTVSWEFSSYCNLQGLVLPKIQFNKDAPRSQRVISGANVKNVTALDATHFCLLSPAPRQERTNAVVEKAGGRQNKENQSRLG